MKRVRINVSWRRIQTGTTEIEVQVSDDADTYEASRVAGRIIKRDRPDPDSDDVEVEDVLWLSLPPGGVWPSKVPDEAWTEVDGHRWATEGHILIRDDCAPPWERLEWATERKPTAEGIRMLIAQKATSGGQRRVSVFNRPVIEAGEARWTGFRWEVWRDGELIAIVMGMHGDELDSFEPEVTG